LKGIYVGGVFLRIEILELSLFAIICALEVDWVYVQNVENSKLGQQREDNCSGISQKPDNSANFKRSPFMTNILFILFVPL